MLGVKGTSSFDSWKDIDGLNKVRGLMARGGLPYVIQNQPVKSISRVSNNGKFIQKKNTTRFFFCCRFQRYTMYILTLFCDEFFSLLISAGFVSIPR